MANGERGRVVWVLGAGFSRSLGGPLLEHLLTANSREELRVRYREQAPDLVDSVEANLVYGLYRYGLGEVPEEAGWPTKKGERMWEHAEDFLDYLDTASKPGARRSRIEALIGRTRPKGIPGKNWGPTPPEVVAHHARRLVAAECCAFLSDVDLAAERWEPYIEWIRTLDSDDTIITFNYDRVLESMSGVCAQVSRPGLRVVTTQEERSHAADARMAEALKLHGSVDWRSVPNARNQWRFEKTSTAYCITSDCPDLMVATPGPTKKESADFLKPLWEAAEGALQTCVRLYFIGYRFPPSDAHARGRLLRAISQNRNLIGFDVVLADDVMGAKRVESLVDGALAKGGRTGVPRTIHPLRAEDFLTIWPRH